MNDKQDPMEAIPSTIFSTSKIEKEIGEFVFVVNKNTSGNFIMSSKIRIPTVPERIAKEIIQNPDFEKQSLADDLISSWKQVNERIEETQKAIQISKIETRVMLDYLKEITIDVG